MAAGKTKILRGEVGTGRNKLKGARVALQDTHFRQETETKEQAGVSKEETKEVQILPTATKSAPFLEHRHISAARQAKVGKVKWNIMMWVCPSAQTPAREERCWWIQGNLRTCQASVFFQNMSQVGGL